VIKRKRGRSGGRRRKGHVPAGAGGGHRVSASELNAPHTTTTLGDGVWLVRERVT